MAEDIGARIGDGRKPFTTQGEWWIPESDIKVGGTLSYADGRIRLSLVGLLEETPDPFSDEPIPVVFGMTSDGIEVTLCDCRYLDWQSAETHGKSDLLVGTIFIGAHLPQGVDSKFEQVGYSFSGLTAWATLGAVADHEVQDGRMVLKPTQGHGVEAAIPVGQVVLNFGLMETGTTRYVHLDRTSSALMMLRTPMTGDEIFSAVTRPLQQFLTFVCDKPAYLLDLTYRSSEFKRTSFGNSWPQLITCIHSGDVAHGDEEVREYEMLLPLSAIRDTAAEILERWFEIWSQVSLAMDLLFGTLLGPQTYTETRFLLLAQAAETYAGLRFPDAQRMNLDQKARRARVLDAIKLDPADHAWLKEALSYVHEPTFAEKLHYLVRYAGYEVHEKIRPGFEESVKHTRNFFTHYDPKVKTKAVTELPDLYRLAEEVIVLLQFCLMHDLGFESNQAWLEFRKTFRGRALPDQPVTPDFNLWPPIVEEEAVPGNETKDMVSLPPGELLDGDQDTTEGPEDDLPVDSADIVPVVGTDEAIAEQVTQPLWRRLLRRSRR